MLPDALTQELQRFLHVLHARCGEQLVSVVLFGSWARGEARPESDIDLLVISQHFPRSRLDRHPDMFQVAKAVSADFAAKVSIHSVDTRRSPRDQTLVSGYDHGPCAAL